MITSLSSSLPAGAPCAVPALLVLSPSRRAFLTRFYGNGENFVEIHFSAASRSSGSGSGHRLCEVGNRAGRSRLRRPGHNLDLPEQQRRWLAEWPTGDDGEPAHRAIVDVNSLLEFGFENLSNRERVGLRRRGMDRDYLPPSVDDRKAGGAGCCPPPVYPLLRDDAHDGEIAMACLAWMPTVTRERPNGLHRQE